MVNFIKGIFIGAGAILPGISSGVICMVTGLYEKLLESILSFFKDIKNNFKFLFPICLGAIIGILLFSSAISYCLELIPIQTKSVFIGLLLGSLSILIKDTIKEDNSKTKSSKYVSFFICFFIGIGLILLENYINYSSSYVVSNYSFLFLILSGFFMSIGIIVPGVSSTIILMILGIYNTYLSAISSLNISILFPILIGIIIGSLFFMKIIQMLLNKYHSQTMFGIIGFGLGSIFILYPNYSLNISSLISIILLILGYYIGKNIKQER